MIKMFNHIFSVLKIVLVLVSFIMILYIMLYTFHYSGKNAFGNEFFEFFGTLLPFILVLMVFVLNYSLNISSINSNILFNVACNVALLSIVFIGARTVFDQNMIFWAKDGYNINFHYFSNQIVHVKLLVYFIFVTNILLIIENKLNLKKEINILE